MKAPYNPQEIKHQAGRVRKVWKVNRGFRISDATFEDFEKVYVEFDAVGRKIEARLRELGELRKDRDKLSVKLNELTARARSGMRGYFGPKSVQYGQVKWIGIGRQAKSAAKKSD